MMNDCLFKKNHAFLLARQQSDSIKQVHLCAVLQSLRKGGGDSWRTVYFFQVHADDSVHLGSVHTTLNFASVAIDCKPVLIKIIRGNRKVGLLQTLP